jgi:hypothetical protein
MDPMTRRAGAWLAAAASLGAFGTAVFLRMSAAYGPFNLSTSPADWMVLWELLRHGQIAAAVALQSLALGLLAATVPWRLFALAGRRRGPR